MSGPGGTLRGGSVDLCDAPSNAAAGAGAGFEVWVRRGCALVVASVAAYASYVHQLAFALQGGADAVNATLWLLSVDGLLLPATVGLLNSARGAGVGRGLWCGWRSCSVSPSLWRRMLRPRLRWSGSRCWWRAGRWSACCSRWSFSHSVPEVGSVPRAPMVRRRLTPKPRTSPPPPSHRPALGCAKSPFALPPLSRHVRPPRFGECGRRDVLGCVFKGAGMGCCLDLALLPSSRRRSRRSADRTGTRRRAGRPGRGMSWPRCRAAEWPIRRARIRPCGPHRAHRVPAPLRRRRRS